MDQTVLIVYATWPNADPGEGYEFRDLKLKVDESAARTCSLQVMDGSCILRFV